jgi:hypothetical protein
MASTSPKNLREVWVTYNTQTGRVKRLSFRAPKKDAQPPEGFSVSHVYLSEMAISHAHQLRVADGRVVSEHALVGI